MRKPDAYRLDYQPGPRALQAIEEAVAKEPGLNRQAVLDKLVIYGRWAMDLKLAPPALFGGNRQRWR